MKMLKSTLLSAIPLLLLTETAFAGCATHSSTSCADGIVHLYDPGTGEVCDPLDCGGGRAPPKSTVPGCPLYTGTETRTTSTLSCWTATSSTSAATTTTISSGGPTTTTVSTSSTGNTTAILITPSVTSSQSATQTANAGNSMGGSLIGIAGVAFGAVALL